METPKWLTAVTTLSPPLSFPGCTRLIPPPWKAARPPLVLWMIFLCISTHMVQDSRLAQSLNSWEIIIIFLCGSDSNPGPESCSHKRESESQIWLLLNSGERLEGHVAEILRESNLDFSESQTGLFPPEANSYRSGMQISKGQFLDCLCGCISVYGVIIKPPAIFFSWQNSFKTKIKR